MRPSLAAIWHDFERQLASIDERPSAVLDLSVGGVSCVLHVHGVALADAILPAFAGLAPAAASDQIELHLWDHRASGTAPAPAVVALREPRLAPRFVDGEHTLHIDTTTTTITRSAGNPAVLFACDDAATLPHFVRAAPLPHALATALATRGIHLAHAACVGVPELGGILLAGKGGSGKSTTALRCLRDGWLYVGDDYVVLDPATATAHRLYATAKLHPAHLAAYPDILPTGVTALADPQGVDKSIAFLHPALGAQLVHRVPIRLVARCCVGHRPATTWRRIPAGEALLALAPSTLLQLPTGTARSLAPMAQLVRAVPTVEVAVGTDLAGIAPVLAELLQQAQRW